MRAPSFIAPSTLLSVALSVAVTSLATTAARADAPVSAATTATITVEVDKLGLEIFLDGRSIGTSPIEAPVALAAGHHTLATQATGHARVEREFDIVAGDTKVVVLHPIPFRRESLGYDVYEEEAPRVEPVRDRSALVMIAGGALTLLALGTGITANGIANGDADDARAYRTSLYQAGATDSTCSAPTPSHVAACGSLHDALTGHDRYADIAVAGYVAAGVLAAATIAYWVWPASRSESSWIADVRPAPMIGEGTGGLQLVGSF